MNYEIEFVYLKNEKINMKITKNLMVFIAAIFMATMAFSADLGEARKVYSTQLTKFEKAPQKFGINVPPDGVSEVEYPSGKLLLKAWISSNAEKNANRPAVVFLHGGFSFGNDDWLASQEFVKAGYVLLMPMLRGENGNDGNFELFGGEVDDAIAAGRYLAQLPGIDKKHIYLAGHSVGGSLAILASQMQSPFKASAALSGYPRLLEWIDHFPRTIPFDINNAKERNIRDPYLYATSVKIPLYLFSESQNVRTISASREFCGLVAKSSYCQHEIVPGNHQEIIVPAIKKILAIFKEMPH